MSHIAPSSATPRASTREQSECERMIAKLIATPAPRMALLQSTGTREATLLRKVLEDPVVRDHFSGRCVLVSCDSVTSTDVIIACLASALGLVPSEDAIGAVLDDVETHGRTLIVLENLDAICSPADPEQQEATDVMLATLASLDELALIGTFSGYLLPDCVAWTSLDFATNEGRQYEPQPALSGQFPEHASPMHRGPRIFSSKKDAMYKSFIANLVATPTCTVSLELGPTSAVSFIHEVLEDPAIQAHYTNGCVLIPCLGMTSSKEVIKVLALKLGLQLEENVMEAVIGHVKIHGRTLVVLEDGDAILRPETLEEREATELLLATFTSMDELTIILALHEGAASKVGAIGDAHQSQPSLSSHITSSTCNCPFGETEVTDETDREFLQVIKIPGMHITIAGGCKHICAHVLEDPGVRDHYANRRAFVLCGDITSSEVVLVRLASALGLAPDKDLMGAIRNDIKTRGHTLFVLDKIDAMYLRADLEQQKAMDAMVHSLTAMDGLTLLIRSTSRSFPIRWETMGRYTTGRPTLDPVRAEPDDGTWSVCDVPHTETRSNVLAPSSFEPAVASTEGTTSCHRESVTPQILARYITLAQSRLLPAKPAIFHGRNKELECLVAHAVVPSIAPIGIVGPGGIGKTALALRVMHDQRIKDHFGKERFFLTCEDADSPDLVLAHLAGKLDVRSSQDGDLWPRVLDSLRSRQRVLLLIDNFESIWSPTNEELREASEVFLAQLAVIDELTLLVTTRGNLLPEGFTWANADSAELDTLSSTAARQTFNDLTCLKPHILESEPEASALTKLLREVDFVPLAITLLARLDDLPSRLLREWSEYYTAVLEADRHDGTRRELSVEVSIKISLAHLPGESTSNRPRKLLSVLGQLPAGLFPEVSSQLQLLIPNLDSTAQDLMRHSLVYKGNYGELRMLSPVRHYVSASMSTSFYTQAILEDALLGKSTVRTTGGRLDIEGPAYDLNLLNQTNVFTDALNRRHDSNLVKQILNHATVCNTRAQPCLELLQKLEPHIKPPSRPYFLLMIALQYFRIGELQLAAQLAEQSAELYNDPDAEYRSSEAAPRLTLSFVLDLLGQTEDLNQPRFRHQALEQESWRSDYTYLVMPGEDPKLAEQRFRNNREVSLHAGDGRALSRLSNSILNVIAERDDIPAFIKELELTIALGEQTQPTSQPGWLAYQKMLLAKQHIFCGTVEGVEDLLIDAYILFSEINDSLGFARVLQALSKLRWLQGRFREGAECAETAAKLFGDFGAEGRATSCYQIASKMRQDAVTWE